MQVICGVDVSKDRLDACALAPHPIRDAPREKRLVIIERLAHRQRIFTTRTRPRMRVRARVEDRLVAVAEVLEARIAVHSEVGVGTTFYFSIPATA